MQAKSARPLVYLVAVDGSSSAVSALEMATAVGASLGPQMELHLVHVVRPESFASTGDVPMSSLPRAAGELGRPELERACEAAQGRFRGTIIGHLALGEPWREIVQLASHLSADLVVVGSSGRTGLIRAMLGSVAEQVVRHAGCPVLVARPKDFHVASEIEIDPPCPQCMDVQRETNRARLWCARHEQHHPRAHLHYEAPPTFGLGSMNLRPDGGR